MQRQVDKTRHGFEFLSEVSDSDIRAWKEFTESPLYAFLVVHFEKERKGLAELVLRQDVFIDKPLELAKLQGRVYGHREVLHLFFDKVKKEHEQRVSRHADERARIPG